MEIKLFKWSKYKNSTALPGRFPDDPVVIPVDTFQGELINDTSITAPAVAIRFPQMTSLAEYGYAYIQAFQRYYYIKNYTFDQTRWILELEVDPLASFRNDIRNTDAYVLRASNWPTNFPEDAKGMFTDSLYPAAVQAGIQAWEVTTPFSGDYASGMIVVGIISGDNAAQVEAAMGAVSYYMMDPAAFQYLCWLLMSNEQQYTGVDADVMDPYLLKCIFNPLQYFASAKWYPYAMTGADSVIPNMTANGSLVRVTELRYGWWAVGGLESQNVYRIESDKGVITHTHAEALPHNPDYSETRKYVDYAPYRKITLYAYPFGVIPIDTAVLIENRLAYRVVTDLFTGSAILDILAMKRGEGGIIEGVAPIYRATAQFGCDIPLAQIGQDLIQTGATAISAAANTIGSIFSLNPMGAIATAASGISDAIHQSAPQLLTMGTTGSISIYRIVKWDLVIEFYLTTQYNSAMYGFPVCFFCKLADVWDGYVKTADPLFRSDYATLDEITAINDALTNGIYLL